MSIPERDWKLLKKLHDTWLQRFCERALSDFREAIDDPAQSAHERFLNLFELTRLRNYDMAKAFDDLRRSTALHRLIAMRRLGVVTDAELVPFSEDTRTALARFEAEFNRPRSD